MIRWITVTLFILMNLYLRASNDSLIVIPVTEMNSSYNDYAPIFIDSNTVIFTSSRPDSIVEEIMLNNDNMYFDEKEKGNWNSPKLLSYVVNSDNHETSAGISTDRKTLFIYKSFDGGDLYFSKINGKDFSPPKKLQINSPYYESSACYNKDTLFFVSDRPGGKGNLDIYFCTKNNEGKWSKPLNMEILNSDKDENFPYITSDGNTLYFSSKGHNSVGGYDIFKTIKNAGGQWSEPRNIGTLINTVYDEICFTKDLTGTIYFSSNRPTEGNKKYNIYTCIEKKIRKKVPIELTGSSPMIETKKGVIKQVKKFVEVEGCKKNIPLKIEVDITKVNDSTDVIKVKDLIVSKQIKILDNSDDSIINISIFHWKNKKLSLDEVKKKIGFKIKYCRIQIGAFSKIESISDFIKKFPLLADKVIMIRSHNFNRFLMRETFESIDSAAVLQQKCIKEYHSVPDTFIAVYDGKGNRRIIYFDLDSGKYILLKPEEQTRDIFSIDYK